MSVSVTKNHAMIVDEKLVFAHQVAVGAEFACFDQKDQTFQKSKITKIEMTEAESITVFNVVTPEANFVANGIVASCMGEKTVKNVP